MNLLLWGCVLLVCLGAGAATGGFLGFLNSREPIQELEYYDAPQVTRILDGTGQDAVAELYKEKRQVLTLAQMPPALPQAFIAIEDERFYDHFGIDPRGVARAIVTDLKTGRLAQGASTITMQMVRNVLERVGTARTKKRKITEAFMALQAEGSYSKDQILEFYLNQIFLGHHAYGVQAAAQTYFGKNVADLTVGECATLASIPKSPSTINPITGPEKTLKRRNYVLDNMARLGMITAETSSTEAALPLPSAPDDQPRVSCPWFIDHVCSTLEHNSNVNEDVLTRGGYRVYSTVNTQYQQILEAEIPKALKEVEKLWQEGKPRRDEVEREDREKQGATRIKAGQVRLARIREVREDGVVVELDGDQFVPFLKEYKGVDEKGDPKWTGAYRKPYFDPDIVLKKGQLLDVRVDKVDEKTGKPELAMFDTGHVQGAAVVLDVKTGHVLALVGGSDSDDTENFRKWNRATQGGRQPGSTFKPFTYAAALSTGKTLASIVADEKFTVGNYTPRNYENTYSGDTTLYWALSESNNVVTVKTFMDLGFKRAFRFYRAFDIVPSPQWDLKEELPLCLGSLNCTPLSMAAAYRAFACNGLGIEPLAVTRVTDLEGKPITADGSAELFRPAERKVLSPEVAYLVTATLMEVAREGSGKGVAKYFSKADYPVPQIAGKTGTTSDCVDAWFIGYTPDIVLAYWVGFDRVRSMGTKMTGAVAAVPGWCQMMDQILRTRTDWKMTFDVPDDIVMRDLAAKNGPWNSDDRSDDVFHNVPFIKGTEPK